MKHYAIKHLNEANFAFTIHVMEYDDKVEIALSKMDQKSNPKQGIWQTIIELTPLEYKYMLKLFSQIHDGIRSEKEMNDLFLEPEGLE